MKIIVIGMTGTIGAAIAAELGQRHEVVGVARSSGEHRADITDKASLERVFHEIGQVDAIVSAAGGGVFKPLMELTDADFRKCLDDKLMGQVDVVRTGISVVRDGGSITVTTGLLAREPMPGSVGISLINAGLEGFVRAAALELKGKIRVNAVSPPWIGETLAAMGRDPAGGLPAATVAKAYADVVEGEATGTVVDLRV